MEENKGFVELRNVKDYWKKLLFDFDHLRENEEHTYTAFNFFVTAYHLIDWIFEGQKSEERTELHQKPLMKLCSHIANGAKHFHIDSKRHKSVKKIEKDRYVEEGYVEEGYFEEPIIIYLSEPLKSKFGESISVVDLAEQIIDFWKNELTGRNLLQDLE